MSFRQPIIKIFAAAADLSAKQYYFVKWAAAGLSVDLCGLNEKSVGVLMNAPTSGQPAEVAIMGGGALLKLEEASMSAGDLLTPTAAGKGEQCDAADEWCGAILEEDGTAGDVKEVFVTGFYSSKSDV